jgi:hypothetical protein
MYSRNIELKSSKVTILTSYLFHPSICSSPAALSQGSQNALNQYLCSSSDNSSIQTPLDEKEHRLEEHLLERPELARVINNVRSLSPEGVYAFDVLNVFSHAYEMRERKVLNENEWYGWVQWMRTCFRLGTIKEYWKQFQQNQWYDPTFEDFINKQVIAYVEREIR